MSKAFKTAMKLGSAFLGVSLFASTALASVPDVEASQQSDSLADIETGMEQVTNVSQFSDVRPGDWAYEALRGLVERYGCIAGYPNGTFRGNRALSRYEFAAGLNACLQQVERLIAASTADFASKEDLEALRRLTQEFQAELASLGTRVDKLEARTQFLENHQFSTTTKLEGEVVFGLVGVVAGDRVNGQEVQKNAIFGHRTRLNLETSFTGKDLLRTRLQVEGLPTLADNATFTPEGDLKFLGEGDNQVNIDALLYSFPLGERTEVIIAANAGAADDIASTVNILDGDGGSGALSTFGTRHPIYYLMDEGAGVGIKHEFGDRLELSLGYMATQANDPTADSGLFNGPYATLAQLLVKPTDKLNIGLTYLHAYNRQTGTGSNRANPGTFLRDNEGLDTDIPTSTNAYGVELSWQLSDKFVLGGWAGYMNTRTLTRAGGIGRGDLDIWNWAVTLGFPDLGKKGNLGGIIVGMEPKVTNSNVIPEDADTSLHVEAFYQYQLTDNIAVTPGVIWLTAPDHNSNNQDAVIGTIRTTFTF